MYYFFSAALPELRPGETPPLALSEFDADAELQLTPRHYRMMVEEDPAARVYGEMRRFEEYLRTRIAEKRAEKLKIPADFAEPEAFYSEVDAALGQLAQLDPAERERAVDMLRWKMLDELTWNDEFGFDHICAYRIKLRLAEKYRGRDAKTGRKFFDSAVRAMAEQ